MVDGGDVEEVEEHRRTSHNPRSIGEVAGVGHNHENRNPSRDRFESERTQSRAIMG
jgi:hypothetical protein